MWITRCFILGVMLFSSTVGFAKYAPFLFSKNIFNYIGQPGNQQAQLVVLGGYRIYNSGSGQFLKQDSYSPFQSKYTLNGFSYVSGNPVLLVDVIGHMPQPFGRAVAADESEWIFISGPVTSEHARIAYSLLEKWGGRESWAKTVELYNNAN